jgi:diguanylate cyclase (GGDEF)-like protein
MFITRLLALARAQNDDIGIALGLALEASATRPANPLVARAKLDEALPHAQRSANVEALWQYFLTRGDIEALQGKFDAALDCYLQSMRYADQMSQRAGVARLMALRGLSEMYVDMKNPQKALGVIDEALALAKAMGSRKMLALLYKSQSNVYRTLGRDKEDIAAMERALSASRSGGLARLEAIILNNMGNRYLNRHDYIKAEPLLRQALAKFQALDAKGGVLVARANVGFAVMGQGRVSEGAAEVRAVLEQMHAAGTLVIEEQVRAELSRMYEDQGLYREALSAVREQQKLSEQLFRSDREKTVAALQEQFDASQRQKQIEMLARENTLKDAELRNYYLKQMVAALAALVVLLIGLGVFLLYRRARKANRQLQVTNQQLEVSASHDPLTGLRNRRAFLELMGRRDPALPRGRREDDHPDGLLLMDIDHFKTINDTLGHAGGDAVLVEVARRLRVAVRDTDMVMRWGGEEFLIFSPKASAMQLQSLARRVLDSVGALPIAVDGKPTRVTLTMGYLSLPFSGVPETQVNWEKALQIADMALYLGKVNGRNRAYGLNRLLVPHEQALPVLERDITAAINAGMVEMVEVQGPHPGQPQPPASATQQD